MTKCISSIFSFFKKYYVLFLIALFVSFGISDIIEVYFLRLENNWTVATYYLLSGISICILSCFLALVHILDDLYCKISGKEPDKNKNENKE